MVDENRDSSVAIVRGANFQMIVLNQLFEIPFLDIFKWNRTSPGLSRTCWQIMHWLTYCAMVRRMPSQV